MDKGIIKFTPSFYKKIRILKSFIKPYFLDNHKVIKLTGIASTNKGIMCEVNFGRHVIQFIEYPEILENFETSICFSIEELEKYGKIENEIKLVIKDDIPYIRINKVSIELTKQTVEPEKLDLPYTDKNSFDENTYKVLNSVFKSLSQKENLITGNDKYIYEKITDSLYQLKDNDTKIQFVLSYDDLKLITQLLADNQAISFVSAPRYYVVSNRFFTIHLMKYKPDQLSKSVINKKEKLTKEQVVNTVSIDTKEFKQLLEVLYLQDTSKFTLLIDKECYICDGKNRAYKIVADNRYHITKQEFTIEKKELKILLKQLTTETINIVTSRDFMILNKQYLLLMRSNFDEE